MSLKETREKIDALDDQIVKLLDERARAGREAAAAKQRLGQPLRNPEREMEVLERVAGRSDGSMPRQGLKNIYRAIMAETLAAERDAPPACQGQRREGKIDVPAEVVENREATPGFFRMRLKAPELAGAFQPGQFFQIRLDATAAFPLLRRPFAPSETAADGFSFVYAVVGRGTRRMTGIVPGARVGVLAPLGTPYTLLPAGASALLVGGGCGAPSLAPLARRLREDGVRSTVLVGARTANMLLEHETFAKLTDRLILATDDGSLGCRGTAIDAFRREIGGNIGTVDRLYACGPLPMLKAAAALAKELGVDCVVSLEERMACGFGACVGCAVPVADAGAADGFVYRRVCHDGPVFKASALAWEAMR